MDSEALYAHLDSVGESQEDIIEVLESLGLESYSLVWYDMRSKQLHFARNDLRPMCFATTDNALFFGSEIKMLEWVLDRHKVHVNQVFETEENCLITVPLDLSEVSSKTYVPEYDSVWESTWGNTTVSNVTSYPSSYNSPFSARVRPSKVESINGEVVSLEIVDLGTLPMNKEFESIRTELYDSFEELCGVNLASAKYTGNSKFYDIEDAIVLHLETCLGAVVDSTKTRTRATMQVCHVSEEHTELYGYIDLYLHDYPTRLPVSVRCTSKTVRDRVRGLLVEHPNHAVALGGVTLQGMIAYFTGEYTYTLAPIWSEYNLSYGQGEELSGPDGLKAMKYYGKNHIAHILKDEQDTKLLQQQFSWNGAYATRGNK
jgi:hypothetical protein